MHSRVAPSDCEGITAQAAIAPDVEPASDLSTLREVRDAISDVIGPVTRPVGSR